MNLREFEEKKVRIVTTSNKVFEGLATDYTYAEDNEPEEESITLVETGLPNPIEFRLSEIKKIEELSK